MYMYVCMYVCVSEGVGVGVCLSVCVRVCFTQIFSFILFQNSVYIFTATSTFLWSNCFPAVKPFYNKQIRFLSNALGN